MKNENKNKFPALGCEKFQLFPLIFLRPLLLYNSNEMHKITYILRLILYTQVNS